MTAAKLHASMHCVANTPREALDVLNILLEALVQLDVAWFRANTRAPGPYDAGLRYQREPRAVVTRLEQWLTIPYLYERRHGDCEDLSAAVAAWYRLHGDVKARAVAVPSRLGPRSFHCIVRRGDGTYEDPSRKLGMAIRTVPKPNVRVWEVDP